MLVTTQFKNLSIINHVYQKAKLTGIEEVYVATGDKQIFEEVIIPFNERATCEKCNRFEKDFDQTEHFPILPNPG